MNNDMAYNTTCISNIFNVRYICGNPPILRQGVL